jgi:uncharacterized protein
MGTGFQTGWDADRLDLRRVAITPHPNRLYTEVATRPETIQCADGGASLTHSHASGGDRTP